MQQGFEAERTKHKYSCSLYLQIQLYFVKMQCILTNTVSYLLFKYNIAGLANYNNPNTDGFPGSTTKMCVTMSQSAEHRLSLPSVELRSFYNCGRLPGVQSPRLYCHVVLLLNLCIIKFFRRNET